MFHSMWQILKCNRFTRKCFKCASGIAHRIKPFVAEKSTDVYVQQRRFQTQLLCPYGTRLYCMLWGSNHRRVWIFSCILLFSVAYFFSLSLVGQHSQNRKVTSFQCVTKMEMSNACWYKDLLTVPYIWIVWCCNRVVVIPRNFDKEI